MENELPKSGLIVTPSSMATAIAEGRKTLLVKTRSYDIANREMLLLDRDKALAVVKIGDEQELENDLFGEREDEHLITKEIRKDWSEAQPSWSDGPFFQWPIEVVKKFDEPLETSVEIGPAVVIEEVETTKRGPFGRRGGSGMYADWIIKQFPKHKKYVEPFAGSASVFFKKEPSGTDVLADYDTEVVNALKTIKTLTDKQIKSLESKDRVLSKNKWTELRNSIPTDSLDRLHRMLYLNGGGWSSSLISYRVYKDGKPTYSPGKLAPYKERLNKGKTVIEHADWRATVKKHDSKDTLFFIDCPYPGEWVKRADDIPDNDPNRGESISLDEYAKVLKSIKGSYIFVLGDHKEHVKFLKSLDNVEIKTFTGTEAASSGGTKVAKRYFAFKVAGCSDEKPKKKSFDEVESNSIEFIDVTEDKHTFDGLDLTPEIEPESFSTQELVEVHKRLHEMYTVPVEGWSTTDIVNYHSLVVDELYAREKRHPAPPDNGLDDISFDFENFCSEQPKWFELEKVIESELDDDEYVEKRRLALWGSTAGKSRVAKRIVAMIPEHKTYVEPFAGGAAVFYAKDPSEKEVLCDSNPEVVHAFKFVQSASEKEIEALGKMDWTVSKPRAKAVHEMKIKNASDRFFRFAYKRYALFMRNDSRITGIDPAKDGQSPNIVDRIPETKERLKGVTILDGSYEKAISKFDSPTTFYYLDPPYPNCNQNVGEKDFDEEAFIKALKSLKGKFLLHYEIEAKEKFSGVKGWSVKTIDVLRTPGHTKGGRVPGKLLEVRNYELQKKSVKKNDLYLSTPEGERPFTVQNHWVGKSMGSILRIGVVPGRSAIGWLLDTQRTEPGEPVTTLAKSRELTSSRDAKIDWSTGRWETKKKAGGDDEFPVEILCKREPITSYAWLDIEARTMEPNPGAPPPLGGSAEYPGVFEIVEKGVAEFGAQTEAFHEYFLRGSKFSGRATFRMMNIRKSIEGTCQVCGVDAAIDVGWADESAVKLCKKCFGDWQQTEGVEQSVLPEIEDGADISFWFASNPQDSTPYVLTEKAVIDEWMPPYGVSALPQKIKSLVPPEYAYWDEAGIDAREMRDALVKAIRDNEVLFEFDSILKSEGSNRFVLQKQAWEDGKESWFVRIDSGKSDLNVIELQSNPVEIEKSSVQVWVERYKSSMDVDGFLSAAHYLNPRKGTRSTLTKIDSGGVSILSDAEESTQVEFSGDLLKGIFVLNRNDNGYLLEKNGSDTIAEIEKMVDFELVLPIDYFEIQKDAKGKEKRLVTGIVLEPDMIDAQDDTIKAAVIEKAAHLFLSKYNKETKLGLMHTTFGDIGLELCQSFIAPVDYSVGKKKVKKGSWVMTTHVTDDSRWDDIKNRRLTGYSIGGKARMAQKR